MNGMMANSSKESGKIIKCMAKDTSNGLMDVNIKGALLKIRDMGMECFAGEMEEHIEASGTWVNNMV